MNFFIPGSAVSYISLKRSIVNTKAPVNVHEIQLSSSVNYSYIP